VYRTILFVSLALLPASLTAQQENRNVRQGFWAQFGLGAGSAGASCSEGIDCGFNNDAGRETGPTATIKLGGTIKPTFLLGGGVTAYAKKIGDADVVYGATSLLFEFYPSPTGAFYFQGGPGYMIYEEDYGALGKAESSGFNVMFGVGFDIRVGRMLSLSPYGNYLLALSGDATWEGSDLGFAFRPNMFEFGVGLTIH